MNGVSVIKVGGSLLDWPDFPRRFRGYLDGSGGGRVVLVVGGGRAGDFIRALDLAHAIGEKRSHGLALRSLDLTAHVAAALVPGLAVVERPDALEDVWGRGRTPVLAPRWFLENVDLCSDNPLAETWEVTTDSIAARVARHLGSRDLRLVKSDGPGGATTRADAARAGFVDPMFPAASAFLDRVAVINLRADPIETGSLA